MLVYESSTASFSHSLYKTWSTFQELSWFLFVPGEHAVNGIPLSKDGPKPCNQRFKVYASKKEIYFSFHVAFLVICVVII